MPLWETHSKIRWGSKKSSQTSPFNPSWYQPQPRGHVWKDVDGPLYRKHVLPWLSAALLLRNRRDIDALGKGPQKESEASKSSYCRIGVNTRGAHSFFHGITPSVVIVCLDPAWILKRMLVIFLFHSCDNAQMHLRSSKKEAMAQRDQVASLWLLRQKRIWISQALNFLAPSCTQGSYPAFVQTLEQLTKKILCLKNPSSDPSLGERSL